MIISLLVAMDEMRGIGIDGRLPWHLPADLKLFKKLTMGHHLIMGRKTYESIDHLLPGRIMIVVTRNSEFKSEGCLVVHSLESAINFAENEDEEEVFIIGGEEIFDQALTLADRIYMTLVHIHLPADVFFPVYEDDDWEEISTEFHPADENNPYPFTFKILFRKTTPDLSAATTIINNKS
jgi:dihydrofolate reductase